MPSIPFADAVVVAAGSSRRMGGVDKLQVDLDGRSVLAWSVEAMRSAASVRDVVVVTGVERVATLSAEAWVRALGVRIIVGGDRRQDSVAVGVRATDAAVVLVHDGARPLVTPSLVDTVAAAARDRGAAIPVLAIADSLKHVQGDRVVGAAERGGVARAQTPQGARRELLLAAIDAFADGPEAFGDEAELLARAAIPVSAVPGEATNLKVTLPEDIRLARALAAGRSPGPRYATGSDSHPFGPDDGLRLGGIELPEAPRLWGHSDGDAALHAICDGLLAAAGMGDLGRVFPAGDPATRGIDSRELLANVVERLIRAGHTPASVDVTITAARPRLGGARLDQMRAVIAGLTGLPETVVSVKAATGNLAGAEGAGRAISAIALVGVLTR